MKCPTCGRHTNVLDTRWNDKLKLTRRRRWCPDCQVVFTTREVYKGPAPLGRPKKKKVEGAI